MHTREIAVTYRRLAVVELERADMRGPIEAAGRDADVADKVSSDSATDRDAHVMSGIARTLRCVQQRSQRRRISVRQRRLHAGFE